MGLWAKAESGMEQPRPRPGSPCWKKKEPDAGLLANARDHLDQFVNASMDQHRICLKKSIRGVSDFVKSRKSTGQKATQVVSAVEDSELSKSGGSEAEGSPTISKH